MKLRWWHYLQEFGYMGIRLCSSYWICFVLVPRASAAKDWDSLAVYASLMVLSYRCGSGRKIADAMETEDGP